MDLGEFWRIAVPAGVTANADARNCGRTAGQQYSASPVGVNRSAEFLQSYCYPASGGPS